MSDNNVLPLSLSLNGIDYQVPSKTKLEELIKSNLKHDFNEIWLSRNDEKSVCILSNKK